VSLLAYLEQVPTSVIIVLGLVAFGSIFWALNQYNDWRLKASVKSTQDVHLIKITRRTYREDETVVIDGHHFLECEFIDCAIAYNGGPFKFENNKRVIWTPGKLKRFVSTDPVVMNTLGILNVLNIVKPKQLTTIPK